MEKLAFFFAFFVCCCCSHFAFAQRYNALFNFGDSLSDTGNVVLAGLPYGMTYFGHHTGRCSDGRLVIDFIAEGIGLPHLPPNTASNASFHCGANFAFIAAPALSFDFFHHRGLSKGLHVNASLHEQIDRFQKLLPSICGSPQDCRDFLSKSLLVVGEFGGNDYNTGLFGGWSITKVSSFVPHVTRAVAEGIERLIGLGAVDLIVPSVLPVGCFPLYLTLYQSSDPSEYGRRTGCLRRFNALSWYHNAALRRQLDRLRKKYPAASIRYADFYAQLFDFVIDPLKYVTEETTTISATLQQPFLSRNSFCLFLENQYAKSNGGFTAGPLRTCCGAPGTGNYNFNLQAKCDQNGSTVCSEISAHVSWDGIHMTETAHRIIAQGWLNGPYVNPPILSSLTS